MLGRNNLLGSSDEYLLNIGGRDIKGYKILTDSAIPKESYSRENPLISMGLDWSSSP